MQSLSRVHRAPAELGARGRGVAVVEAEIPLRELQQLQSAGVRGIRLNLYTLAGRYPGDRAALVERFARLVAPLGWHLQFFADAATLVALEGVLARAAVEWCPLTPPWRRKRSRPSPISPSPRR